ncbi:hypothetical protein C8J55DRAFT_411076, partial [Lentinula edodes]
IEEEHILDITHHNFLPLDLRKLVGSARTVDGCFGRSHHEDYPTLDSLLVPLHTYFTVVIDYLRIDGRPEIGCVLASGSHRYMSFLTTMAKSVQWSTVLDYHVAYMDVRRQEMKRNEYLGWGTID